jgi:ribonuclease HI
VGREEEGVSSLRPELAVIARTLQEAPAESDLLYLCDSEASLNKMSRWIGSGPRTTLAGDANADIMTSIIECERECVWRGARTFMVKVKAHRGEPLNERADTQAENANQMSSDLIRQKLVRRLLEEQDKVLRAYFAQKGGARSQRGEGGQGKGREHVKWDMYA